MSCRILCKKCGTNGAIGLNRSTRVRRSRVSDGSREIDFTNKDRFHKQQTHDQVTRCVGHDIALLSRVRGDFQSPRFALLRVRRDFKPPRFALHRVHGGTKQRIRTARSAQETQTRIRTAQSARILELQIEIDKLEFLAEFTKRPRCEATKRTTPTDDVRMNAKRPKGQLLNRFCGNQENT